MNLMNLIINNIGYLSDKYNLFLGPKNCCFARLAKMQRLS